MKTNCNFDQRLNAREGTSNRTVSINSGPLRYAQSIRIGAHLLQADEPADAGGSDIGPNPHELLMAALGVCASITAQMYAERKHWHLQSVRIGVCYNRVLSANNITSGAAIGMVDQFEMQIALSGDLSEEQRSRLFEIANRCPIHRMLTSAVKIHSRLLHS